MRATDLDTGAGPACQFARCDGSGWLLDDDDTAYPCACREQRITKARAKGVSSVIPRKFRGVGFDRPPITEIDSSTVGDVRRYVDNLDSNLDAGRGLWLMGPVGTGKTSLAMVVSKEALKRGRTVAIYSMPKLLWRLRQTYEAVAGEDTYAQFFERLVGVDLLHLDDLGAEKRSDWVLEQLYSLINERYEEQRAVLVTTNLTTMDEEQKAELEEQIGRRTVSRLTEMCEEPVPVFGDDARQVFRPPSALERHAS
ncbi:MAG: ATP-binding protein [Solirubrobacterales bacterium]